MDNDIFEDKSKCANWRMIMGDNCLLWFLPIAFTDPIKEGLDYGANIAVDGLEDLYI